MEAKETNPLTLQYLREIRKQANAINPKCEASTGTFGETVNHAVDAARLESMRRAGVVIPAPDGQVIHDTAPEQNRTPQRPRPWWL